jgi:hypothetical protein
MRRVLSDTELKEIDELLEQESKGGMYISWKDGVLDNYLYTKELLEGKRKKEEERVRLIIIGIMIAIFLIAFFVIPNVQ